MRRWRFVTATVVIQNAVKIDVVIVDGVIDEVGDVFAIEVVVHGDVIVIGIVPANNSLVVDEASGATVLLVAPRLARMGDGFRERKISIFLFRRTKNVDGNVRILSFKNVNVFYPHGKLQP